MEQTLQPFITHTLQHNETLWDIAKRYGISVIDLIVYNMELKNPDVIPSGYTLRVPVISIDRTQLIKNIIQTSCQYHGHPHSFLHESYNPSNCNCNEFIQGIFKNHGVNLPKQLWRLSEIGEEIPFSEIEKGDLLFFTTRARSKKYLPTEKEYLGHVHLYIGNKQILHGLSGERIGSTITELNDYYQSTLTKAVRIIPGFIPINSR